MVVATGMCGFVKARWERLGADVADELAAFDAVEKLWVVLLHQNSVSRSDILLACVARVDAAHEKAVDIAHSPS